MVKSYLVTEEMLHGFCLFAFTACFEQEKTGLNTVILRTNHIKITLNDISQYLITAQ